MVLPPALSLWVWMLLVFLGLVELPGGLQKCIYDQVQAGVRVVPAAPNQPRPAALEQGISRPRRRSQRRAELPTALQPIRIRTWIPAESSSLSEAEAGRMEAAVEEAVRMVSSLLSVNRVPGPLLLSRDINKYCKFLWKNSSSANYNRCGRANSNYRSETCLDVLIPDDHLAGCDVYTEADSPQRTSFCPEGSGLSDTDFLLYLHVHNTDKCRAEPRVLAYSVHCQTDPWGRPLAGLVVVCKNRLTAATYSHQATVQTVIHELFHALGFSRELFHTWRDCSSTAQADGCSPRRRVTHSDGSGQTRIYSPSVVSALQRHLDSRDPELGAPLENLDAAPGRASSHWESRVLQGSIMAAVLGVWTTVRIDPVTLAALQDTGWYTVNHSRAQSLVWGDGEGATFGSLSACRNKSSSFFCTGSGSGCHHLHLHKGQCQTDQHLDGCGVYKPLKNGSECWKEENAREDEDEYWSGEIFGFNSRCFFSSLTRQTQSPVVVPSSWVEARCYRHRCTGPDQYQVQVSASDWLDCPAGTALQVAGYQGVVHCPERRLCLYADVTPPSDDVSKFPATITSEPPAPVRDGTWPPPRPPPDLLPAASLCVTAAACLLAAAAALYRKCLRCKVRIHCAPEGRADSALPHTHV